MILFYTTHISGEHAFFPPEESRHIGQVLRKQAGARLSFVDGSGGWYAGEIEEMDRKGCSVRIIEKKALPPASFQLHLGIAPTKQPSRMEWLLEKVTEIGISEISLLECSRSERQRVRMDRWERILQSAMKQSLRAWLPRLNDVTPFEEFIRKADLLEQRFIAWCDDEEKDHLKNNLLPAKDVMVLVGPEGDFSPEEISLAKEKGFLPVSLGPNRLRTETAGLVACQIANLINQ